MKKLVSLILVFVLTLSVRKKPRPNLTSLRFTTPQALPTSIPL